MIKYPIEEFIYLEPTYKYSYKYGEIGLIIDIKNVQLTEHSLFSTCYKVQFNNDTIDFYPIKEENITFRILTIFDVISKKQNNER